MKHPDGIQGYIDVPGSGQDMFQVPVYRGRVQRIDFSDVDSASFPLNVRSDFLKLGERLSSDEDPCSFASEFRAAAPPIAPPPPYTTAVLPSNSIGASPQTDCILKLLA